MDEPVKRGRGRPRKNPATIQPAPQPKRRGRPPKNPEIVQETVTVNGSKPLTASQVEKRLRSIIGHRRSGKIRFEFLRLTDLRKKDPVTTTWTLDLDDQTWEARVAWWSKETFGGRTFTISEVEPVPAAVIKPQPRGLTRRKR